jgi:hypothetical protein
MRKLYAAAGRATVVEALLVSQFQDLLVRYALQPQPLARQRQRSPFHWPACLLGRVLCCTPGIKPRVEVVARETDAGCDSQVTDEDARRCTIRST